MSNARYFGRPICESNLYIDGAHAVVPKRTGHFLKEGVDQVVNSWDVAGIETYLVGDAPPDMEHTVARNAAMDTKDASLAVELGTSAAGTLASSGCVTLIWLRH